MSKRKRKLTAAEKREKKRRRREYMTIFINGKQKRVKREPTIDGLPVDEFIRQNADPIWLLQNEMYEELYERKRQRDANEPAKPWLIRERVEDGPVAAVRDRRLGKEQSVRRSEIAATTRSQVSHVEMQSEIADPINGAEADLELPF